MSKLDELINTLCLDGVDYKKLIDICTDIIVPMRDRPKVFDGNTPWCRIEDIEGQYFNGSLAKLGVSEKVIKEMNLKVFPAGTVICSCSASIGAYAINTQPLITNQTFIGLVCGDKICNKFLLYYMETQTRKLQSLASTGTIPYISRQKFEDLIIPLPPLPVQREIVRILDSFTELTVELTAELTARKKQYEYYRDALLTFGDDVPMGTLGTVATNLDKKRKPVTKGNRETGEYPYYGASGIVDYVSDYIFDGDYLLVSEDGANLVARTTPIAFSASGKIWVNNHAHVLKFDTYIERKFVEYYLNMIDLSRYISTAAQPKLTQDNLNKIPIPVPSIEDQAHIVFTLDRFDALCNDISIGLPAEIEARKKQYEYYRDKLLTFPEAKA